MHSFIKNTLAYFSLSLVRKFAISLHFVYNKLFLTCHELCKGLINSFMQEDNTEEAAQPVERNSFNN